MSGYRLRQLLERLDAAALAGLEAAWLEPGEDTDGVVEGLLASMQDPPRVTRRWGTVGDGARAVLGFLLRCEDLCMPARRVIEGVPSIGRTETEVRHDIDGLARVGLLFRVDTPQDGGEPALAIARETARVLRELDRSDGEAEAPRAIEPFTLKEFLEARHFGRSVAAANGRVQDGRAANHARQAYKLFLMPAAVLKRIARLPPDVRELVELAMTRFGGLLPRSLFLQTRGDPGAFGRADLSSILEDALIGRVGRLDLRAYGIDVAEETLCVFQEVCLIYLRSGAEQAQWEPEERVAGVDLATNVMRFLHYVDENPVRYTVKGEIFKATRKRMISQLVTGEEDDAENAFGFIYGFAVSRRLVERTGERRLRLSDRGREFEARKLPDKLKELLAFAVEDPHCGGDPFHQVKLRRILLRLLRRLDPDTWHDAMYVPFLARNSYLAQMEGQGIAEYFAQRRAQGCFAALEDLQRLSWNVFHWVRKRLHLLGIVDLGFQDGHPVALRLSRLGASLLAGAPAQAAAGARSTLVVNPDFEILLFPENDAYELVHTLDRFSTRTASDRLYQFRLSEESVRSALADGMGISEILEVLTDRCRTPLPQNVLFSLTDWGDRAGAVSLDADRVLHARRPELLARLLEHERVRDLTTQGERIRLDDAVRIEDFRALLRDLGFYLECAGERLPHGAVAARDGVVDERTG